MARTKNAGKGKMGEGSSSHAEEPPAQRQRTDNSSDEEDMGVKPIWGGGPLSDMPREWQLELFRDKMNELTNKHVGFICERVINREDFAPFGVIKHFQDLGWDAVMGFDEMKINRIYVDPIEEWMGSLQLVKGNHYPRTMSLVGSVAGRRIVMSRETLQHIARFDTKASNQYVYPDFDITYDRPMEQTAWNRMIEAIFEPGKGAVMVRNDLKTEAKLLLMFMNTNVMPRRGDKASVRHSEVAILYSLLTGTPKISFRHLAMMNIWEARNSKDKRVIPHCKLIQALLRQSEVLDGEFGWEYKTRKEVTYEIRKLKMLSWEYRESERYHRLADLAGNRMWDVLKADARPLRRGERDIFNSEGAIEDVHMEEGDDDADDQPISSIYKRRRGEGSSRSSQPQPQYVFQNRGTPWGVVDDDMQRVLSAARPEDWRNWPSYARVMFDQGTQNAELQRREVEQVHREVQRGYERNEQWNRLHAYNFQQEINHNFEDAQLRRMHEQWHGGQTVVQNPPVIDYTSLGPYDGSVQYPLPPTHHSAWVPPYQGQQQQQQGDGTPSVFNFSEMDEMMTDIFGPQQPRYF